MKNIKNWKLIAVLGGLLLIFAAIKIFRSPQLERSLPDNLVSIDSSKITELIIRPAQEKFAEIHLVRKGKKWEIKSGNRNGKLEQGGAATALSVLSNLRPERMISRRKEKWNEFSVGDSTGTRVQAINDGDVEADVWIGKSSYAPGGSNGMSMGSFTYVRLADGDAVYTVNGFLESQFNRAYVDWLDKTFTRLASDSIKRIQFTYPADSSFVLEKKNGVWASETELVDSVVISSYLRDLAYKNLSKITEQVPAGEPKATIVFESKSGILAKLEAWPADGQWIVRSSYQPATFFLSPGPGMMKEVWKGKREFIPTLKK